MDIDEELKLLKFEVTKSCYPLCLLKKPKNQVVYCACGQPGSKGDREVTCGTQLTEEQIDAVYDAFWEAFVNEKLDDDFFKRVSVITGRKLEFDELNRVTVTKNVLSLLLFYTRTECGVVFNVADYIAKFSEVKRYDIFSETEYLKFPICLNDGHIIQLTNNDKLRSRFLDSGNLRVLSKFFKSLSVLNAQNPTRVLYRQTLMSYVAQITYIQGFEDKGNPINLVPVAKIQNCKVPHFLSKKGGEESEYDFFAMTYCDPCSVEKKKFQLPMSEYNELFRSIEVGTVDFVDYDDVRSSKKRKM